MHDENNVTIWNSLQMKTADDDGCKKIKVTNPIYYIVYYIIVYIIYIPYIPSSLKALHGVPHM